MLNSQKVGIELYENLGKMFYAVAMTDGSVHIKELDKLKEIVRESWLKVDDIEDRYHVDAAYQIETVFDWLLEYDKESEECFDDFVEFYADHKQLFPEHIKNLIKETAGAIANSYSGKNKSELIIIAKIELLFKD
ncbi:hypothetical protein MTsPCn9_29260 [Croceitalea sp. MTPC9]|nr:hypothetical protein MTsPCn6_30750 [Croceitalea sp. MTPC6]GMN17986.1 hypothetical protein MTsPCn9_29260 [Croceitalea sp. MTPC9]